MKSELKDKYLLVAKSLINVMFFSGIPTTIAVPFFLKWYGSVDEHYKTFYIPETILFVICGIFACLIVYELKKMLKTVEIDDCFVSPNVISLKHMGIYSFIIGIACFVRVCINPTPGAFALVIVFVIAGLFSKVLSNVFDRAIAYKEENDMTI